jgi:hypothetical protein
MNGIEEDWYSFRQEALEKIAIDWLEINQIPYAKNMVGEGSIQLG